MVRFLKNSENNRKLSKIVSNYEVIFKFLNHYFYIGKHSWHFFEYSNASSSKVTALQIHFFFYIFIINILNLGFIFSIVLLSINCAKCLKIYFFNQRFYYINSVSDSWCDFQISHWNKNYNKGITEKISNQSCHSKIAANSLYFSSLIFSNIIKQQEFYL